MKITFPSKKMQLEIRWLYKGNKGFLPFFIVMMDDGNLVG